MWERNINGLSLAGPSLGTWPATQACALTRNRTSDLSVCRLVFNPLSHTGQGNSVYYVYYILFYAGFHPRDILLFFNKRKRKEKNENENEEEVEEDGDHIFLFLDKCNQMAGVVGEENSVGGLPIHVRAGSQASPLVRVLKEAPEPDPDGSHGPSTTSLLPWRAGALDPASCSTSAFNAADHLNSSTNSSSARDNAGGWDTNGCPCWS